MISLLFPGPTVSMNLLPFMEGRLNRIDFENILNQIETSLRSNPTLKKIGDKEFEKLVFEELKKEIKKKHWDPSSTPVYQEDGHKFPDIGCGEFGIEVKTTESDKWVCLGNSIMEGTSRQGVNKIYVFFLKKGGKTNPPKMKWKKYEECVSDIKTTHSPRYEIDMDISGGGSVFRELGVSYDDFRISDEKIQNLREYYKKKGTTIWWLDEKTGEGVSPLEMKSFSKIPKGDRDSYMVEIFALFPRVFLSDFDEAVAHLVSKYSVYSKNFRDEFSAGGKVWLKWEGAEACWISRIFFNFWGKNGDMKQKVFKYLEENKEETKEVLGPSPEGEAFKDAWINIVDKQICENKRLSFPQGKTFRSLLMALEKGTATFEE